MKKHIKKIIGVLILFLMVSCTLESQFALPNDEKIQAELIGEWHNDNDQMIKIMKNDNTSYKLKFIDKNSSEEVISFSKTIKGFSVMNIKTKSRGRLTNVFYGYNLKGNSLIFYEVNSKLNDKEFESKHEILKFFKENITHQDFFINPIELKRK